MSEGLGLIAVFNLSGKLAQALSPPPPERQPYTPPPINDINGLAFWLRPDWSGGDNLRDPGTLPFWMLPVASDGISLRLRQGGLIMEALPANSFPLEQCGILNLQISKGWYLPNLGCTISDADGKMKRHSAGDIIEFASDQIIKIAYSPRTEIFLLTPLTSPLR